MSIAIELEFPWGRYHATSWSRAANEGVPEWPPSPWRILRALYATWQERRPDLDADAVTALLEAMAAPPGYWLPPSRNGHTRHYYPDTTEGTDLVFDSFVSMPRNGRVGVVWDIELDDEQRSALAELLSALPYLGRAESICEAWMVDRCEPGGRVQALPRNDGDAPVDGGEVRWVLAPRDPLDMGSLTMTTMAVRAGRRVLPFGSVEIPYVLPVARVAERPPQREELPRPRLVRLAIDGPALPAATAAVAMAEALRAACQSKFGRGGDSSSPTLSGKSSDGSSLKDHTHAHYLATDDDGDGLIDHLTVWAPAGLTPSEMVAIAQIRHLKGRRFEEARDFAPVRVAVESVITDLRMLPSMTGPSTRWRSHTPFAPSIHAKKQDLLEYVREAVKRELDWRSRWWSQPPMLADVSLTAPPRGSWGTFRRYRLPPKETAQKSRRSWGLELTFDQPVTGPLSLGQLSHYGLGLFLPVP